MATKTVQLSLGSIVLLFIILFAIGMLGGAVASGLFTPPAPLTPTTNGTIVPVSQQITVSPSKLTSELVATHGKSVFLLAHETPKGIVAFGIGTALTNDGIIMSVTDPTKEPTVALGEDGVVVPLTAIGHDEISGIFFYKASNRIVPPVNLLQSMPSVGSSLLALARQEVGGHVTADSALLSSILLPSQTSAPGIQKLASIASTKPLVIGTPLLDEHGSLAAVVLNTEEHTALFVSDIRSALERLSSNKLSYNPFASLGFTLSWKANLDANRTMHVQSIVQSVEKGSPSDISGLQIGDVVTAIAGNTVSWDTNIGDALSARPAVLTIMRQEEQRTLTITE